MCPVVLQLSLLIANGVIDDTPDEDGDWPSVKRCFLCDLAFDTFADLAAHDTFADLAAHVTSKHQLPHVDYNVARDSIGNSPACSHCTQLFTSMEGLRTHHTYGRCSSFNPDRTAETEELPPELQLLLEQGSIQRIFQHADWPHKLTVTCIHCGESFQRAADCLQHLQLTHGRLWRASKRLVNLFIRLFQQQCLCQPQSALSPEHVCTPLIQLAMTVTRLQVPQYIPFVYRLDHLDWISPEIDSDAVQQMTQILHRREFSQLWKDPTICALLADRCLLCGELQHACLLRHHFTHNHHLTPEVFTHFLQHLMPQFIQCHDTPSRCNLCGQHLTSPYATMDHAGAKLMLELHLTHLCPVTLHLCLILLPEHGYVPNASRSPRSSDVGIFPTHGSDVSDQHGPSEQEETLGSARKHRRR